MGYRDIWPWTSHHGSTITIQAAPMKSGETFVAGEPIFLDANGQAQTFPKDGTEALLADATNKHMAGIALNGPGTTATAELTLANGWRQYVHPDTGNNYAALDRIWFAPFGEGNYFVTRIVLAAAGGAAGAAFTGADASDAFEITYCSATTPDLGWGLERTAGSHGTDYVANVIHILDSTGKIVTTTSGAGTFAVFKVTMF